MCCWCWRPFYCWCPGKPLCCIPSQPPLSHSSCTLMSWSFAAGHRGVPLAALLGSFCHSCLVVGCDTHCHGVLCVLTSCISMAVRMLSSGQKYFAEPTTSRDCASCRSSACLQVLSHRSLLHCSSRGAQLQRLPHAAAERLPSHHVLAGPLRVGHALPHCGDSPGNGSLWSLCESHCSCCVCCSVCLALLHARTHPELPCAYLVCYACHLPPSSCACQLLSCNRVILCALPSSSPGASSTSSQGTLHASSVLPTPHTPPCMPAAQAGLSRGLALLLQSLLHARIVPTRSALPAARCHHGGHPGPGPGHICHAALLRPGSHPPQLLLLLRLHIAQRSSGGQTIASDAHACLRSCHCSRGRREDLTCSCMLQTWLRHCCWRHQMHAQQAAWQRHSASSCKVSSPSAGSCMDHGQCLIMLQLHLCDEC